MAAKSFSARIKQLRELSTAFDAHNLAERELLLKDIAAVALPIRKSLIDYTDLLLFLLAYPANEQSLKMTIRELVRLTGFLKRHRNSTLELLKNSGLPFTLISSTFSQECLQWLIKHDKVKIDIESIKETRCKLIDILRITLPSPEREYTSAGFEMAELFGELKVRERDRLSFIIDQFKSLNDRPMAKDLLFEGLDVGVKIEARDHEVSRPFNRLPFSDYYYHTEILKKFDHIALLNLPLPNAKEFIGEEQSQCVETIKRSMLLAVRETDPATFMDVSSLRLFELERGISIAVYGMAPERQLPFESYIGFTLFKNGYPASYGGGWVFGRRSLFGINIFEAFRGGESGYILCQLLRVYRQAYGVNYFEVEPYQYGADNPDGISSGAFWFYYRFGFRPLDKQLRKLASSESDKIRNVKGYRSHEKILIRFTESNIALNLAEGIPMTVSEITRKITRLVATKFDGLRSVAVSESIANFRRRAQYVESPDLAGQQVLEEVALFAEVFEVEDSEKLQLLKQMINEKPSNLYRYQQLWIKYFSL